MREKKMPLSYVRWNLYHRYLWMVLLSYVLPRWLERRFDVVTQAQYDLFMQLEEVRDTRDLESAAFEVYETFPALRLWLSWQLPHRLLDEPLRFLPHHFVRVSQQLYRLSWVSFLLSHWIPACDRFSDRCWRATRLLSKADRPGMTYDQLYSKIGRYAQKEDDSRFWTLLFETLFYYDPEEMAIVDTLAHDPLVEIMRDLADNPTAGKIIPLHPDLQPLA